MPSPWPSFTWDARAGQYRAESGRFVSRSAVREALDEAIDRATVVIERDARLLQVGAINLAEWQLRTEAQIRAIHVMSAAIAAGGWAQATAADWAMAGRRIKAQYKFLAKFARQIANGLPLDGRFLARAISYGSAGSGTYEAVLRRRDLATGRVIAERRRIHSLNPCDRCLAYSFEVVGWTDPGTLPDTGTACECGSRCRCSFERRLVKLSSLKFTPSDRASREGQRTVWADMARLDDAFQRDEGFAIGKAGAGAIAGRLAAFRRFLRKGDPIEMPEVTVDPDGTASFTNGRHRFAALRDMGLLRIPVSVARGAVALARKVFGVR